MSRTYKGYVESRAFGYKLVPIKIVPIKIVPTKSTDKSIRFGESILLGLHTILRYYLLLNVTSELLELREKEMSRQNVEKHIG